MVFSHLNYQVARAELENIAQWWLTHTQDEKYGGFVGEVDSAGTVVHGANKGVILNSRILWFFSEMALFSGNEVYKDAATRAFIYLMEFFDDKKNGGAFWEVSVSGVVVNDKKQTYAQCFCIYAFSAYFKLTGSKLALVKAQTYFDLVEQHARDREHGGYVEAFTRKWQVISDFRLSDKDQNTPKSMNTHLHVLEAYSAYYHINTSTKTQEALRHILDIYIDKIIDMESGHQRLFFDNNWSDKSTSYSYGHDIEASWLLWEAAQAANDSALTQKVKSLSLRMAEACLQEALGEFGQLCDEYDFNSKVRHQCSDWWVQAEALVGFAYAYELSANPEFLKACDTIWQFIVDNHLDKEQGEWHWLSNQYRTPSQSKYKVGFWKGPYHNGRAMMELCRMFNQQKNKDVSCV